MKHRTSILSATLLGLALLAPLAACGGGGDSTGSAGSGGTTGTAGTIGTAGTNGAAGTGSGRGGSGGGGSAGGSSGTCPGAPAATSEYATYPMLKENLVDWYCGGAGCHGGEMTPKLLGVTDLYNVLTTTKAPKCGNRVLIKPCDPMESALYLAITDQCKPTLSKMPFGCVDNTCVDAEVIEGLKQWILKGAPKQ